VEPYAVTVHPLSSSGGFTLAQLADLARGQDQEYKLVVGDGGAAARDLLGLDQLGAETILADDWTLAKEYVARHEGTIALLPWEQVDFRVRVAPVEGHRLDPRHLGKYPLVRRLWLASQAPAPKPLAEDLRSALHYEPPPIVELVAVGDIVLDGQVKELMQQEGSRYAFEAEGVRDLLSQANIAYGNLESSSNLEPSAPRGTEGSEVRSESWINPQAVAALTYAGFDLVSLAHSQTDPHADLAVTDTLRLLSEADIAPVGAGGTITEAQEALVIEADGLRVAFLAHSQSGPSRDGPISGGSVPGPEHLIARVRAARMTADLVVVSCRWGAGYAPHPSASQKGLAQSLAQAGAALIIGHHPHVVQGLHYHDDTFTAYGLGNFVYDQSLSHQTSEGLILRCLLDASGVKTVELLPICIYRCQPSFMSPEGSRSFLQRVMQVTQGEDALPR